MSVARSLQFKPITYTGTGAQDLISVDPNREVSVIVTAGASDDVDLEFAFSLKAESTRAPELLGINSLVSRGFNLPIGAVGLTINTNNSGAVKLEILQGRS